MDPDDLATTLSLPSPSSDDDLERACFAASGAIDEHCDTVFALSDDSNDEIRSFTPLSSRLCQIDDAASITSVDVDTDEDGVANQTWTLGTDFVLERTSTPSVPLAQRPFNRLIARSTKSFPRAEQAVFVTGRFGWSEPPWQVVEAAGLLAQQLYKRRKEAPFGVLSFGIDQPTAMRVLRSDPHLCMLLDPFGPTEVG